MYNTQNFDFKQESPLEMYFTNIWCYGSRIVCDGSGFLNRCNSGDVNVWKI